MTVNDLLGWLHENPFYPNRRRQALWYAIKYLTGEQLARFARYAKSISYAFSREDLALLNRVMQKARGNAPQYQQAGIGQLLGGEEPGFTGDTSGGEEPGMPGWMSAGEGRDTSGGMIPGLSEGDEFDVGGGGFSGEGSIGGPGSSGYLGSVITGVVSGLVKGVTQPTGVKPQVGARHPQNPNFVWNGSTWVYSPPTTATGTTTAAPTAAQTQLWLSQGKLVVGAKTTTGWTWNGSTWIPTSQYTPTYPGYVPTTTTTTTTKDDNTLLWGFGLLALLLLSSRRNNRR